MDAIPGAFDEGDKGSGIVAANIIVIILATIAVGLRIVSRRMQRLALEADDFLIFAALPFGWAMCICTLIAVKHGLGKHIGTVPPADLIIEGQAFYASEIIWATSIPIIKLSILLLYIRIFGRLRYFKNLAYIIGIFSVCWGIMVILVCALQCRPVQFTWDKSVKGTCINAPLFFIIGSAPNVLTDFVLLVLPLPAVWNLHTTRAQKISLTGIFMLGSLTCIISLVRFVQLITNANMDATWSLGIVSVWSTAEPNLGIVSACLPTMKPLLRRFLPQSKTRSAKASKQSRENSEPKKEVPSATTTESFGSSGFNKFKGGRSQFRELDDDVAVEEEEEERDDEDVLRGTQTHISSSEVRGGGGAGIPLNVIEVKTNLDWQNVARGDLRR
ncbi:MAG: hypothetical protein L6R36_003909 [Xanthoria steineri]|nr:MAG: hypothetical protein L6R36_003909 [Xanthoria steineri]